MSFWLEPDDEPPRGNDSLLSALSSQQSSQPAREEEALEATQNPAALMACVNCGGTEFEFDDVSGQGTCLQCYTQSQQSQSQQPTQESSNFEDLQGLAAKQRLGGGSSGAPLALAKATKKDAKKTWSAAQQQEQWRVRRQGQIQRLQQKHQQRPGSNDGGVVPLPSLPDCVEGFQRVLIACARILVQDLLLLGDEASDSSFRHVKAALKRLWLAYLQAWSGRSLPSHSSSRNEAADTSVTADNKDAPPPLQRWSLREAFLHPTQRGMVMRHLSQVAVETIRKEQQQGTSMTLSGGGQADVSASMPEPPPPKRKRKRGRPRKSEQPVNQNLVPSPPPPPSMNLAAALLWLATIESCAVVVSAHEICGWIANGSLPLLLAYSTLISSSSLEKGGQAPLFADVDASGRTLAQRLKPIAGFFQLDKPPTPALLESLATQLARVCGLEETLALSVSRNKKMTRQPHSFLTLTRVPVVAAQLIADLRLGPRVLEQTLKLLGIANSSGATSLVTVAVPLEQITTMAHVVALIAHACQQCSDWRSWKYDCSPELSLQSGQSKRCADRVVPWTSDQYRHLIGNGSRVEGYLDFLQEQILVNRKSLAPPGLFASVTADSTNSNLNTLEQDKEEGVRVRPNVSIAFGSQYGTAARSKSKKARTGTDTSASTPRRSLTSIAGMLWDPDQQLLMEVLAHTTLIDTTCAYAAYKQLFDTS